jgi:hypothetical protein
MPMTATPSASVTTSRWIFSRSISAAAASTDVPAVTETAGEVMTCRTARPGHACQSASVERAWSMSVWLTTPTRAPSQSITGKPVTR